MTRIRIVVAGFLLVLTKPNAIPAEPPLRHEEVAFNSGRNMLKGVLVLPSTPGPWPAVAFVHGSGTQNRDGGGLHRPIREHFARHGIASLCWDKPGCGGSTGHWTEQSFEDRAREALDAVNFLQGRAGVDAKRIGLWGHSQGGWICPLAAAASKDVAFIILVSAPVATIAEQDLYRVEHEMRADGMKQADIEKALAFARRRIRLLHNSRFEELEVLQKEVRGKPWFTGYVHRLGPKDFEFGQRNIAHDGRLVLQRILCPVLVVVAERDTILPAKKDAAVIEALLKKAGNKDVTVKSFAEADHFLHLTKTGGPRETHARDRVKTFAPGYLTALTNWIGKRRG